MKRIVLGTLLALSLLSGAPAHADAPLVDLTNPGALPRGADTTLTHVVHDSRTSWRLVDGSQSIPFHLNVTSIGSVTLLGGTATGGWVLEASDGTRDPTCSTS